MIPVAAVRDRPTANEMSRMRSNCLSNLAEARERFPPISEFGKWCDEGNIKLNKNDRAAAIAMGRYPEQLDEALRTTMSTSIRLIYKNDFRFPIGGKPTTTTNQGRAQQDKATHAIERREQAGEPVTREAIVEEAGVSAWRCRYRDGRPQGQGPAGRARRHRAVDERAGEVRRQGPRLQKEFRLRG